MKNCSLVELSSWEREFEAQRGSDRVLVGTAREGLDTERRPCQNVEGEKVSENDNNKHLKLVFSIAGLSLV